MIPGQGFLPVVYPGIAVGPVWSEPAPVFHSSDDQTHQKAP